MVLLLCSPAAFPAEELSEVATRLSKVEMFAFGGVGFAASTTQGEKDYFAILKNAGADQQFAEIFRKGTSEAKCYALAGLHQLKSKSYTGLAEEFRKADGEVQSAAGCILMKLSPPQVVKSIDEGVYDSREEGR